MNTELAEVLERASQAFENGQYHDAEQLFGTALSLDPHNPSVNYSLGEIADKANDIEKSLRFYKVALRFKPGSTQYWVSYIGTLLKLDRVRDAKAVLKQFRSKGGAGAAFDRFERKISSKNRRPSQSDFEALVKLYQGGQYDQAIIQGEILLQRFPNSAMLHNMQGGAYLAVKNHEAAIASYKQALEINPKLAEAHYNLALCYKSIGDKETEIQSYRAALSIKSDYAEAYANMGNAFASQENHDAAIQSFKKALAIKPDWAEIHNNLGNVFIDKKEFEAGIASFRQAIKRKADYFQAHANMGVAYQHSGDYEAAINSYKQSIEISPTYAEAGTNLAVTLKNVLFNRPDPKLELIIAHLLDQETVFNPSEVCKPILSLLRFNPDVKAALTRSNESFSGALTKKTITELSKSPLLLRLMSVCPIPDLQFESLFKKIRASLLFNLERLSGTRGIENFQIALAMQCFTNEYLYDETEIEAEALHVLEEVIQKKLKNADQPSLSELACLGSYKGLYKYSWSHRLTTSDKLAILLKRQVSDPAAEQRLRNEIPVLQELTDTTSTKVRAQYEENPYPRWVTLALAPKRVSLIDYIQLTDLKVIGTRALQVSNPEILIAGCGTGRHSTSTASRFKNSSVLAVDLSLSSLAYAKRQATELGFKNIEYIQGDILNLENLGRHFDIVESSGVLHHMHEPMSGWQVLVNCLRPGGLMRIGLYSETARQHIVKIREEIEASHKQIDAKMIRSERNKISSSSKVHHTEIAKSTDFYSLSAIRDLLFHVQEHRFTLLQVADCLNELGLKFCGFENSFIVNQFNEFAKGSKNKSMYNLESWHEFEEKHPSTFKGMYQFWCEKVS